MDSPARNVFSLDVIVVEEGKSKAVMVLADKGQQCAKPGLARPFRTIDENLGSLGVSDDYFHIFMQFIRVLLYINYQSLFP